MTQENTILLKLLASAINNTKPDISVREDLIPSLFSEAQSQAVLPIVYSRLEKQYDLSAYTAKYYSTISHNIKVTAEHKAIHKLLCENGIPYVILKGCASAAFYPTPLLRTMGDADVLVRESDFKKVQQLLIQNGYTQGEEDDIHIKFKTPKSQVCIELHRAVNGLPVNDEGEKINTFLADIFEKSILVNNDFYRPSDFHHGLIILVHNASHMTKEGIGLRHICDWAVFAAKFSDREFCEIFKKPLKTVGLWKFAQILTEFSVKYLDCPNKAWCAEIEDELIKNLAVDTFNGGNFGKKDLSRQQHVKYISRHSKNTLNETGFVKGLCLTTIAMAKKKPFVEKHPLLLPVGIIVVLLNYFVPIILGKRRLDNKQLINNALNRKNLYSQFELYK